MKNWKEVYQYVLGAIIVLCFFGVIVVMIFIQPRSNDVLNTIIGVLGTISTMVATYFFGSSKGSADKNEMIGKSDKK